jgi:hypothetical protein
MAARDLRGLRLIHEDAAVPVGFAGKTKGAFVEHWFDAAGSPERTLADLGFHAGQSGWTVRGDLSDATVWVGRKPDGNGEMRIIIQIEGAKGPASRASLEGSVRVTLTR